MQVNAETLQGKIKYLELCKVTPVLGISLNEEYQLEAYRMLLGYLTTPKPCYHEVLEWVGNSKHCCTCGKEVYNYE